jgi:hypothetical protein
MLLLATQAEPQMRDPLTVSGDRSQNRLLGHGRRGVRQGRVRRGVFSGVVGNAFFACRRPV